MIGKRIREVDVLRGFAAVCMILGHSFIKYPVDISQFLFCKEISHLIYNFHMELFFVVAGAVYCCSKYSEFISRKAKKLMIPYAFFGLVDVVLRTFGGSAVNHSVTLEESFLKLIFKGGGYWFIYSLFTVFLIYPLIEKICNKPWKELVFMSLLLIFRELVDLPTMFLIDTTCYYLPYFILGHVIRNSVLNGKLWKKDWLNAVLSAVSLAVYVAVDYISRHYVIDRRLPDYIRAIAIIYFFSVAVHYFVMAADKFKAVKTAESFFALCSRNTLQIYLFNSFILVALRTVVCTFLNIESPFIIVPVILAGNLLITLIACKWIIPEIPIVRTLCGFDKKESAK